MVFTQSWLAQVVSDLITLSTLLMVQALGIVAVEPNLPLGVR